MFLARALRAGSLTLRLREERREQRASEVHGRRKLKLGSSLGAKLVETVREQTKSYHLALGKKQRRRPKHAGDYDGIA